MVWRFRKGSKLEIVLILHPTPAALLTKNLYRRIEIIRFYQESLPLYLRKPKLF